MASNFDEWYMSSMLPWESRKDARERYETLYGTTTVSYTHLTLPTKA